MNNSILFTPRCRPAMDVGGEMHDNTHLYLTTYETQTNRLWQKLRANINTSFEEDERKENKDRGGKKDRRTERMGMKEGRKSEVGHSGSIFLYHPDWAKVKGDSLHSTRNTLGLGGGGLRSSLAWLQPAPSSQQILFLLKIKHKPTS